MDSKSELNETDVVVSEDAFEANVLQLEKQFLPKFNKIATTLKTNHPDTEEADLQVLRKAFDLANRLHSQQKRKSGEPYIIHPLAVTQILADFGMDTTTLVAALLHDTVEDTEYSLEEVTENFGSEVAHLVDGVTKLDRLALGKAAEAETIRKMIIAMSQDPRVLVIKVGDRLHNMRTMQFLPLEKQAKKAKETLEVIAPLAHRLGMSSAKLELEDLAFSILYPKQYEEIVRLVADRAPLRTKFLEIVIAELKQALAEAGIEAEVYGRPKHYWSIYQKMQGQGKEFDDIFDLVGIRVICDNTKYCYAAIGVVHAKWQPISGRFKDYIAQPKYGVYQSLHTTLIGPEGKALEVQVRTKEMNETAEYGIAAHWRYKETKGKHKGSKKEIDNIAWMRQLIEWQRDETDSGEFLENLRTELTSKEIFIFTPKGDAFNLPVGSTPVDFAYSIHSEVGNKCIGARVNRKMVPLDTRLQNGDIVEVMTSKSELAGPSHDWLKFVASARAKTKIRQWFAKERKEEAIEVGKVAIEKEARKLKLPVYKLFNSDNLLQIAQELNYSSLDTLYNEVGENHISPKHVVNKLIELTGLDETTSSIAEEIEEQFSPEDIINSKATSSDSGVLVSGTSGIPTKLAKCCLPVPGDKIIGLVTRRGIVSVHRKNCINIADYLQQNDKRLVEVEWANSSRASYLVAVQLEAIDHNYLLSEVSKVLSDAKVNIVSAEVNRAKDMTALGRFTFEMSDLGYLQHVLQALREIDGVFNVSRINKQ